MPAGPTDAIRNFLIRRKYINDPNATPEQQDQSLMEQIRPLITRQAMTAGGALPSASAFDPTLANYNLPDPNAPITQDQATRFANTAYPSTMQYGDRLRPGLVMRAARGNPRDVNLPNIGPSNGTRRRIVGQ